MLQGTALVIEAAEGKITVKLTKKTPTNLQRKHFTPSSHCALCVRIFSFSYVFH